MNFVENSECLIALAQGKRIRRGTYTYKFFPDRGICEVKEHDIINRRVGLCVPAEWKVLQPTKYLWAFNKKGNWEVCPEYMTPEEADNWAAVESCQYRKAELKLTDY